MIMLRQGCSAADSEDGLAGWAVDTHSLFFGTLDLHLALLHFLCWVPWRRVLHSLISALHFLSRAAVGAAASKTSQDISAYFLIFHIIRFLISISVISLGDGSSTEPRYISNISQ